MTLNRSYTTDLEFLIGEHLLPIFDKYYRDRGELPPYTAFPKGLLKDIKKPAHLCALLKPKMDLNKLNV